MASRSARSRGAGHLFPLRIKDLDHGFAAAGLRWRKTRRIGAEAYDRPSISASVSAPEMTTRGIGNEPTVLAMVVMMGPGPSGPGLAASTSMEMSLSLSI